MLDNGKTSSSKVDAMDMHVLRSTRKNRIRDEHIQLPQIKRKIKEYI